MKKPARERGREQRRGKGTQSMNHILVVDDEAEIRSSLEEILREEGYGVSCAATAGEAMVMLADAPFDVVLLDIWLPDRDGLEVLPDIRRMSGESRPEVIIISGHGTIETAVKATKLGAYDFLEKPLSLERTLIVLKNAVEARRLRTENEEFKRQFSANAVLTGESVPVKALRQQIRLMAPTNGRVLIYGESGTGKELIARAIHAESLRRDRVFVELNCAAIPEAHIEAELFGSRRGAQSIVPPGNGPANIPGSVPSMVIDQRGTLERADGGTLYLDEVGDMSLKTQAKVLSALDDQMFTPVGGLQPLRVDVRLIASTNKDLEEEIAKGNFREDLFYRLNVVPFFVPPLRERREDIPLLAREFLAEFGRQYGRPRIEIGEEALETLATYRWPGNVRELKNVIERVLILNPRVLRIERKHLPPLTQKSAAKSAGEFASLQQARDAYEREYILKKIEEARNNISHAAELLGLERSHLYRKMKALDISVRE
jgi:two-component system, NtrC family, nitrogen regulation response regulator NtrX